MQGPGITSPAGATTVYLVLVLWLLSYRCPPPLIDIGIINDFLELADSSRLDSARLVALLWKVPSMCC